MEEEDTPGSEDIARSAGIPDFVKADFERKRRELIAARKRNEVLSREDEKILIMTLEEYWEYKFDEEFVDTSIDTGELRYSFNSSFPDIPEDINRLFRVKKMQIEMMRTRGYDVSDEEYILGLNLTQFNELLQDWSTNRLPSFWGNIMKGDRIRFSDKEVRTTMQEPRAYLTNIYKKENDSCIVFYIDRMGDKRYRITKPFIEPIKNYIIGSPYENIIFVSRKNFSKGAIQALSNVPKLIRPNRTGAARGMWVFKDEELYENPIVHTLSARHELMSKEESNQFRSLYVNPLQISLEDPVVKFNGWPVGRVVKITRDISSVGAMVDVMIAKRLIVRDNLVDLGEKRVKLIG